MKFCPQLTWDNAGFAVITLSLSFHRYLADRRNYFLKVALLNIWTTE